MTTNITIEFNGNYIHAVQFGPDSYDTSLDLWQRIVSACDEHQCFNILGETFTTELLLRDAFDHVKIFKRTGVSQRHRIAWVNHFDETSEAMTIVETVLKNRDLLNGHIFPTVEAAEEWLLKGTMGNMKEGATRDSGLDPQN